MLLRTTLIAIALSALAACGANISNLEPPRFDISNKNAPKNELQTHFVAVTVLLRQTQKLQQETFEERSRGSDYSEAMKLRLEKIIVLNRALAKSSVELYNECFGIRQTNQEIVGLCRDFVMKVFNASKTSDELYQLSLGYVYAGLEKNAAFLTDRNEKRINELIKKQYTLYTAIKTPMRSFSKVLQQTNCCDILPQKHKSGALRIIFSSGESKTTRRLANAIQKASKNTVLVEYKTKIEISIVKVDFQGMGDQIIRALPMAVIGLPIFGLPGSGGDATASASVSVQGKKYPLNLNTFEINARDQDMLLSMLANRIVGAAQFAILNNILEEQQ